MKKALFTFILLIPIFLHAQISEGGYPYSFEENAGHTDIMQFVLQAPDMAKVQAEDENPSDTPAAMRVGVAMNCDISLLNDGKWSTTRKGKRFLRMGIKAENAKGLILYYRSFSIPEGGRLFIYSANGDQVIGAFTSKNNPSGGYFATEMIHGDALIIEYDAPGEVSSEPVVEIYQVHYVYREPEKLFRGQSGPCEVNVNCSEGNNWQNEKRSVAKILLKAGSGSYLCTGALVNNARQDSTPYFLTARHCGSSASLSDYDQWIFFFNYESPGCEDPASDPPSNSIVGSELISQAPEGTEDGSDFKLLELNQKLPLNYNPYFAGWNRNGQASGSGVGIHHPKGDIKKISTYTTALVSTAYSSGTPDPGGMYWKLVWAETSNGHGVTEGGSSGSPIFNSNGKIVGSLTGGGASCSELTSPDFYGKFSYAWESNGSTTDAQLKPFLDPDNTGVQELDGLSYGNLLAANFKADTSVVSIGGRVAFTDQSTGDPEQWNWTFYGGDPFSYSGPEPTGIVYNEYGEYDVMLVVSNGSLTDTLIRRDYIHVTPNIFPNPANEYVTIDFGRRTLDFIEAEVFNMAGQRVAEYSSTDIASGIWKVPLSNISAGTYIFRIKTNIMEDNIPLVVY
jgi:PKD repeat protein